MTPAEAATHLSRRLHLMFNRYRSEWPKWTVADNVAVSILLRQTDTDSLGPIGLPLTTVGEAVQSLATVLVDRGYDKSRVVHQLVDGVEHNWFLEPEFWEQQLGPAVDELARWLDLEEEVAPE